MAENIYPIYDQMMSRADKEALLCQRGMMVWFTGLSGSGKSTIAMGVERELHSRGILCRILDGDNIRAGINSNLGFSPEDRKENIRRIAEIGKLFVQTGTIIGGEDFREVYVSTPLEECERRDVKGLYARARKGEIKEFTGISAPFEVPENPALEIDTSRLSLEESVRRVVDMVMDNFEF